jgi:deoxyadenosine/deoxycytidine kinase
MRTDDELLKLIRLAKRTKIDPVSISLHMDLSENTDDHDIQSEINLEIPRVHYTMDVASVIGYVKIAAKLKHFEKMIGDIHQKYMQSINGIYGPLMRKLCNDYSMAYNQKIPSDFEMKQIMVNIRTLARELASREDRDEAIFDGKRIEHDIKLMESDLAMDEPIEEVSNGDDD